MSFDEVKAAFLAAMDTSDGNVTAAARAVGANRNSAYAWARQAGMRARGKTGRGPHPRRDEYEQLRARGVRRRDAAALVGVHERTAEEREKIADMRREGASLRTIGHALGRPASTIKREIDTYADAAGHYHPHAAHRAWAKSRARPKEAKLAQPGPLRDYVIEKLGVKWSPEQIHNCLDQAIPW